MTRLTIIVMAIAVVFTLTGCVESIDNRNTIRSLESASISISNNVTYLQSRVTAVEEACLQLNARLNEMEGRAKASGQSAGQSSIFQPAAAGQSTVEHAAPLSESKPLDKPTRSSYDRLVGMTISEVLTMLGKPDKVSEDANTQSWTYKAVRLTTESGGEETNPAVVVFERGCVARVVLTEKPPEPKGIESGSTPVQTNN